MSSKVEGDKFLQNSIYFLEETSEALEKVRESYPTLEKDNKLTITPEIIKQQMNVVNLAKKIGQGGVAVKFFIEKSYLYWGKIKSQDIEFLRTELATIFPYKFIEDIQFFLGNNKYSKMYVDDEEVIEQLWSYLTAMVYNSIRYVHYLEEIPEVLQDFDLEKEEKTWKVKY